MIYYKPDLLKPTKHSTTPLIDPESHRVDIADGAFSSQNDVILSIVLD